MFRDTRFLQISDVHLTNRNQLLYNHIDTSQRFRAALSAASHFTPDAVLLTGDIYNTDVAENPEFSTLVAEARQDHGCPVIVLPGNHDNPSADQYRSTDAIAVGPEPGDSAIDFFADTQAIVPVPLDNPAALFSRPIPNSPDRTPHSNSRSTR